MTISLPLSPKAAEAAIIKAIGRIEQEHLCRVLFAVESGSRAWGFPSPDSDWDVRFVYSVPPKSVITLEPGRDVIEENLEGDLDISGWRSDKALKLMLKGNCALREWLASPIVYAGQPWVREFAYLAEKIQVRQHAYWHYRHLLLGVWKHYIDGKDSFSLKRYLYVLRPALAMLWLRQNRAGQPPMDMPALMASVDFPAPARAALTELLARKAKASEIGEGGPIAPLHEMIAGALAADPPTAGGYVPTATEVVLANRLYQETVRSAGQYLGEPW